MSTRVRKRLQKRGLKHRIFDAAAVLIIAAIFVGGALYVLRADPGKRVDFKAVVAPTDIISGGDSTLSISYTNNSKKSLKDVTLTLSYPPFFILKDVDHPTFEAQTNTIHVGNLAPGANGLVKIKGVMFGDVGGEQTFVSTLSYGWDNGKRSTRGHEYVFSPKSSALKIDTEMPDKFVAGQRLGGNVTLTNTGSVAFPEAAIHAVFPTDFRLVSTTLPQRLDETWVVPSLEPQETLEIEYSGSLALDTGEEAVFVFEPSFIFGDERFIQDALTETVATIPAPLTLSLETTGAYTDNAIPARVSWEDQSEVAISNVVISVEGATNSPQWSVDSPVIAGSRDVSLIPTIEGINITSSLRPVATFTLDSSGDTITVVGEALETRLETPVTIEAFSRYFTSAGDQLGRGPLPPRVGDQTIYWAFLNVSGTRNAIEDAGVRATLPSNVSWIDKQSVTLGSGVTYDASTHSIYWHLGDLEPTVANGHTAAASFALGITPSENQAGTTPSLLQGIVLTATDTWTDTQINKRSGSITTRTSDDTGIVR